MSSQPSARYTFFTASIHSFPSRHDYPSIRNGLSQLCRHDAPGRPQGRVSRRDRARPARLSSAPRPPSQRPAAARSRSSSSGSTAGRASSRPTTPSPTRRPSFAGRSASCKTAMPGVNVSELHARSGASASTRSALVRSLHHDNGDHFAAAHWMTTGRFGSTAVEPAAEVSVGRAPTSPR